MFYFAMRPEDSHLGLYLLDYSHGGQEPTLSVALNDGRIVMLPEFSSKDADGNMWPCITFTSEEQTKEYTNKDIAIPSRFNVGYLYDQCVLIEASYAEVQKFRNFFRFCAQFNRVLGEDCPVSVGCAPFYNGEGYYHDGVLLVDPKKEIRGRLPRDIRGNSDVYTIDMDDPVQSDDVDDHITQFFAVEAVGRIPLARTNCVTFATTILHQYCGIDIDEIIPNLSRVTHSIIMNTMFMDFHSKVLKAADAVSKSTEINGRKIVSCRNLKSFSSIPILANELEGGQKIPTHIPALG